jgi:hypothetical protein
MMLFDSSSPSFSYPVFYAFSAGRHTGAYHRPYGSAAADTFLYCFLLFMLLAWPLTLSCSSTRPHCSYPIAVCLLS